MALDFSKMKASVEQAFADLATLEVATLTNPSKVSIDLTAGKSDDIFSSIRQNLSQADLVAYTRFDLGGDAVSYVSKSEEVTDLADKHALMVESALETRKTLFNTIIQVIKDLV
jgi:hypothetical protein